MGWRTGDEKLVRLKRDVVVGGEIRAIANQTPEEAVGGLNFCGLCALHQRNVTGSVDAYSAQRNNFQVAKATAGVNEWADKQALLRHFNNEFTIGFKFRIGVIARHR
jgi:hypothetical protein